MKRPVTWIGIAVMWIGLAALFMSVLSGQWEVVGATVPHAVNGPAGNRIGRVWPGDMPRQDGFAATRHAPIASNCQRDSARSDVFELQCESNNGSN